MARGQVLRPIALMAGIILVGGVVLGLLGWAAMALLPEGDGAEAVTDVGLGDPGTSAEVAELAPASEDDAVVDVDTCEIVDGQVQVGGSLENTSGAPQAFVIHVGVLFEDELFDGLTADVPVATVDDGEQLIWSASAGSVDPEDEAQVDPECEVDRVGLAEELAE
jgi:hypothetical protein